MARRILIPLVLAGLTLTPCAYADDDDDNAAGLLRRGVELRREHRNEEALESFKAAVALSPGAQAKAQVALAEQALGHWLEAEAAFEDVLADHVDPWIEKNRAALELAHTTVEGHLGWLTVDVGVPQAEVRLDGRSVKVGAELRVAAGARILEVRAAGYVPDARRVEVAPGLHSHVTMMLTAMATENLPAPPKAPARETTTPPGDAPDAARVEATPSRLGPIVLGAAGIVGIGVGGYFGIQAIGEKNERDALCAGGSPPCKPEALTHDANARSAGTASTIAIGAGVALVAAGITWRLLTPSRTRSTIAKLDVAPLAGPGFGGLVVGGSL